MLVSLFSIVLAFAPNQVPATSAAPLTMQAALDEALANNPELRAMQAQLEADRRGPEQERFLMPPMLEAVIWQWPQNTAKPSAATYMLTAQQDFPGRGKRGLRERLATAEVAMAAAAIPVRARDIVADVKRTYAEVAVGRKAVEISGETIDLLRQIADGTQVRYAAGKAPQQDVLKTVVEISRLHEERLMLQEKVRMAEARLNTLLGRAPEAPIGALAAPRETFELPPAAELQRRAVEHQPELAMARADVERAEAAVALARGEKRPDFFVRGGYMIMPDDTNAFTAAVGITWPNAPWSRKRLEVATGRAELDVKAARARYDAAANGLRLMVQEAYVRVQAATERAALLRTSLIPQTGQALDVSRIGYNADRGTFLDIIDNQRMLTEARLGHYRALADLEQARADLERAVGTPFRN